MRIGELAERAGVTTRAIRHYEGIGVLPAARRSESGYRLYGEDALARLAFVRAAQAVGLTLGEIRGVVAFRDRGEMPCEHVLALVERRGAELAARIAEMGRLRVELESLARRARVLDPADCPEDDVCHIIAGPSTPGRRQELSPRGAATASGRGHGRQRV
jgi:DNA-binding transcriptional MerR regulator